jgi:signal transduction histidine kinase
MTSQSTLPIKMVGGLSAMVFALSFGLEILVVFQESRNHQLLLSALIVCLALWALIEANVLRQSDAGRYSRRLFFLLLIQAGLVSGRAALLIFPILEGFDGEKISLVFLAVYVLVFLGVSQFIINLHSAKLEEANRRVYEERTQTAVQESRAAERERLLQDMHDGFGSQLATARMMAEHGSLKSEKLAELLQECIADLYLFTDTLGNAKNTLADGLADLRFRTQQRCGHLPIAWNWRIEIDPSLELPQRKVLQLLRITQEAINNVLRHSQASEVTVGAYADSERGIVLAVSDNGVGLREGSREGRGFAGMRQRAREIGAQISIQRLDQGTRVDLVLPFTAQA